MDISGHQQAGEGRGVQEGVKERLFLTAEKLIADNGFEAVTTRDITARADANIAAINYHYGSKGALLLEIFRARATELNRERGALLRAATTDAQPEVRAVLRALIEPSILWPNEARRIALRFLNRARSEGPAEMRDIIRKDVGHLSRFADALHAAMPQLPKSEIAWRLHFALGVLHHNSDADYERLAILSGGACDPGDREALLERVLDFIAAGFAA
ncbi:transcriptional regulator, TetR family [Sphingomonas laterariae]|uniref:Transcriptional regulator, TetR family n=1 Tax=Edaphosphingomonas laterariae TaxID=861865 RepID=A0A239H2H4_9SPHN|nr:TetR family transcriptional regulator [Sphingomonas laterariae]SNS75676.1 transcriptional regulator, TetR family [Sphingomonas laterariae]